MPPVQYAGVDVGGTRTKAVLMVGDEVVAEVMTDTPSNVASHFGAQIARVLVELRGAPAAVGVVVPGMVEDRTGLAIWSANLGWRDLDVPAEVRAVVGIPVFAGHDVRAGLLGEATYGAGRECKNVLFVALGTGVASALMSSGVLMVGSPWTGEIGHVRVGASQEVCGCGARGCLEAVIGARSLAQRWRATTGNTGEAEALAAAVAAGDAASGELWTEAVVALAQTLAPIAAAAGMERIIVGGGLSNAGETLLNPLRREMSERLPGQDMEVVAATLGDRAAALGAAELARVAWTKDMQ